MSISDVKFSKLTFWGAHFVVEFEQKTFYLVDGMNMNKIKFLVKTV